MRIGVSLPVGGGLSGPEAVRQIAQQAEALGYDSLWMSDHLLIPERVASRYPYRADGVFHLGWQTSYYEPLGMLGFLAGVTSRLRLGVGVLVLPYRNAVASAKTLATIDNLAGGRLVVGAGAGWMAEEFAALGLSPAHFAERGARADECIGVFRALWTEGLSSFHGRFYDFEAVGAYPKPAQPGGIPIWVGGHAAPSLRRAARLGDGWHATGLTPAEIHAQRAELHRLCAAAGRDPSALAISNRVNVRQHASGAAPPPARAGWSEGISGDEARLAADLAAYRESGVDELIITFRHAATLEAFLHEMESFRAVLGRARR